MLKKVSAIKVRQNLGEVMNEVALKSDEYIVERAGKPLVAIIPIDKYLSMKRERDEFFRMYEELQGVVVGREEEDIDKMTLADKIQTMEALWDDLCHHVQDVAVPEWHYEVLAAREKDLAENKERFTDWEAAKEKIRESAK